MGPLLKSLTALAIMVGVSGALPSPGRAGTLDFAFSFGTDFGGGAGIVTGTIFGLNEGVSSASSVSTVNYSGLTFVFPGSGFDILRNSFTVSGGNIVRADLEMEYYGGGYLFTLTGSGPFSGHDGYLSAYGPATITPVVPAAVPLPASGLLLFAGLVGLVTLRNKIDPTTKRF